jgi:1,4-alpha-glucan branching enzyme
MKKQEAIRRSRARAKHSNAKGNGNSQFDRLMRLMSREVWKTVHFEIAAYSGSKVYVAGTFNNWNPTTHPLRYHPEDGVFRATLQLPAGSYEYKFVVDGVWHIDYECPHWGATASGTLNSVIHVENPNCAS